MIFLIAFHSLYETTHLIKIDQNGSSSKFQNNARNYDKNSYLKGI
jgi:hypothetical protein